MTKKGRVTCTAKMTGIPCGTIYLDNAATTFPKPPEVVREVCETVRCYCGNPGRSGHRISVAAAEKVYACRVGVAEYFGASEENVIFSQSATTAINTALKSVLRRGDHVLISDIEHNSVLRPVHALACKGLVTYDIYTAHRDAQSQTAELARKVTPRTSLVVACHTSNICPFTVPLGSIGRFCRERGITFMTDVSQSAGHLPVDMRRDCIDILCAPGHKGLYGIPGCGFTVFGDVFGSTRLPDTFIEGGSGVRSSDLLMPETLPERLEAGTLPLPAIAALGKGLEFLRSIPNGELREHENALSARLRTGLCRLAGVRFYGPEEGGTVLFSVAGHGSESVAEYLDERGICVRAGLHCAPLAHKKFRTPPDGAVRVSFGAFNTRWEVDRFCEVIEDLVRCGLRA